MFGWIDKGCYSQCRLRDGVFAEVVAQGEGTADEESDPGRRVEHDQVSPDLVTERSGDDRGDDRDDGERVVAREPRPARLPKESSDQDDVRQQRVGVRQRQIPNLVDRREERNEDRPPNGAPPDEVLRKERGRRRGPNESGPAVPSVGA